MAARAGFNEYHPQLPRSPSQAMNRPSHWIIALFAILGPALWVWGLTEGFGDAHETAPAWPQRARLQAPATTPAAPAEALLTGRVTDPRGQPIDGAIVRVIGGRSAAFTRGSGAFEVMVKVGDPYRRIEVTAAGFAPAIERCAPTDLGSFMVPLAPALPWEQTHAVTAPSKRAALEGEGFVYDRDRQPIAGVVVTALGSGASAVTDDIGRYRIPLPTGQSAPAVGLAAWHPSAGAATLDAVATTQTEGVVNLGVAALGEGLRLSGSVRLPGGEPAVNAGVVLRHHGLVRRALTDSSGTFTVCGLIAADYVLELLPSSGALGVKHDVRVESSGSLEGELRLRAEQPRRVRVVDAAKAPHAFSYVVAADGDGHRTYAQADAEGAATLLGLSADGVRVEQVRSQDHAVLTIVDVTAHEATITVVAKP
jgi:hypothetical protein